MRHALSPRRWAPALALAASLAWTSPANAAAPEVLVTIKPVHALVAGVMAGVARPALLMTGAVSPHGYALRPSDARRLSAARLVIWIGPELERFLERPLATLASAARRLTLMEVPGMDLLAYAEGGRHDPHIWLDPDNAAVIVAAATAALGEVDPDNRQIYGANAGRMTARIRALEAELRVTLAPLAGRPYLVAHDAFRYFSRHFALDGVGALAAAPERPPGARHLAEIRRLIERLDIRCLLVEAQFRPAMAGTLIRDFDLRTATLDPLGAELEAGPEAWFELMRTNARTLIACLGGSG